MTCSKVKGPSLTSQQELPLKKPHLSLRINMLPLGRCRTLSSRRSEPDSQHCWSERNCRALAGWRETRATHSFHIHILCPFHVNYISL